MSVLELVNSKRISEQYQKPTEFMDKTISYGTAGFRTKADELDWVMYRMGLLACLRSISQKCQYIGCMITASHNPEEDNGCKLVDPMGDMLHESWESYATRLVNSNNLQDTLKSLCENELKEFIEEFENDQKANRLGRVQRPNIVAAYDTRPSSEALFKAFKTGLEALDGVLVNYGLMTTPQLHYMVRCLNTNSSYGEPNEDGYFDKLTCAFFKIWSMIEFNNNGKYESDLYVDGSNGIGADKIKKLSRLISSVSFNDKPSNGSSQPVLNIHVFNDGKQPSDKLNHLCGADFVKVQQKPPNNLPESSDGKLRKYCSFDGDADRIVYYYLDKSEKNQFYLLDGDKISTLVATHFRELLEGAQLNDKINLCIVQTAYANGSSTNFIENIMKIKASCVPTGVKHLHHEAQKFDIGVYFEANGHGTILLSQKAESIIEERYADLMKKSEELDESVLFNDWIKNDRVRYSLYVLKHLKDCINQTVGDAITDLLVVELIMAMKHMSIADWNQMYTDLPSRQLKVKIKDRNVIRTYDAERRVSQPAELQDKIDNLVKSSEAKMARSFVRPSGTEDVVRVYAEADTQELTDKLAKQVCQLVYDLAGGVGQRP
ncbi:phosphoacetylglucosamine mutase [Brachionus plicatilis]|uniref:Phosphoacetylglucosamine mutase n=1 Tax=Brachionus plicatilis TaxID=10195 RepID=A0A3M7SDY9_BRAPC|nr:phosphoacetylglucosamine mutase [Brachionus plicatilis]